MPWTIYARTPQLLRHGEIDFTSAVMIPRFNKVGSWELVVDGRSPMASVLAQPQWGIEAVNDAGTTVFAGPVDRAQRDRDENTNTLTLYGSDDNTYLAERLAHPQPGTAAPPYNSNEYEIRTGVCSTVLRNYVDANAGASALGPRRVTGLTFGTDPLVGSSVTGRARWQILLELLQSLALAGGGLGFRIRQSLATLVFDVYMPQDRSSTVQFSVDKGNLESYSYVTAKSGANYLYIGGGGEGTARTIREGQDPDEIVKWRRIEKFADRRDTTADAELDQEITKQLQEGQGEVSVTAVPIDVAGSQFLVDYNLGDIVAAVVDDTTITQTILEVKITLTPERTRIVPSLGTPSFADTPGVYQHLKKLNTRMINLERR